MPSTSPEREQILRRAYAAFNARDVEAVLSLMHPEVDWPNMMEETRAHGHAAVRDMDGNVTSDVLVDHLYEFRDGLVARMNVRPRPVSST